MLEASPVLGAVLSVGLAVGALLPGLVVGVPTGFWYHVVLYRIVSAKIAVPRKVTRGERPCRPSR